MSTNVGGENESGNMTPPGNTVVG